MKDWKGLASFLVGYKEDGLHFCIVTTFDTEKELSKLLERLDLVKTKESFTAAFPPTVHIGEEEGINKLSKKLTEDYILKGIILLVDNEWRYNLYYG